MGGEGADSVTPPHFSGDTVGRKTLCFGRTGLRCHELLGVWGPTVSPPRGAGGDTVGASISFLITSKLTAFRLYSLGDLGHAGASQIVCVISDRSGASQTVWVISDSLGYLRLSG